MINFKLSLLRKIVRSYFFDTVKITSLIYHNIRTLYEHEIHKKKVAPICRKNISVYVSTYILFIFYDKPCGFFYINLWY